MKNVMGKSLTALALVSLLAACSQDATEQQTEANKNTQPDTTSSAYVLPTTQTSEVDYNDDASVTFGLDEAALDSTKGTLVLNTTVLSTQHSDQQDTVGKHVKFVLGFKNDQGNQNTTEGRNVSVGYEDLDNANTMTITPNATTPDIVNEEPIKIIADKASFPKGAYDMMENLRASGEEGYDRGATFKANSVTPAANAVSTKKAKRYTNG